MLCMILGHRRDRRAAWYDGVSYRAPCARCGIDMAKDWQFGWRPFDPATDPDAGRREVRQDHRQERRVQSPGQ